MSLRAYRTASPEETRRVRRQIVAEQREFVRRIVHSMVPMPQEREAMQVGLGGVLIALERFDPTCADPFTSTIERVIRGELRLWLDTMAAPAGGCSAPLAQAT